MFKPVTIIGKVIHGEQVGRTIGFPTANIDNVPNREELKPGVYLGRCDLYLGDKLAWKNLSCLPYFGPRHIFGETHDVLEVYIYNFDKPIYDYTLKVTLIHFMREPQNIANLTELKERLEKDKKDGLQLLKAT